MSASDANAHRYCTFEVGGLMFGIQVDRVREVVRNLRPTPVPLAPAGVVGLLNLRGQIVTAIDVRDRLHLSRQVEGREQVNVILKAGDELMSLVVDNEGQVIDLSAEEEEDVPETINPAIRSLVEGAYQLDDELLLILNADGIIALSAS